MRCHSGRAAEDLSRFRRLNLAVVGDVGEVFKKPSTMRQLAGLNVRDLFGSCAVIDPVYVARAPEVVAWGARI